MPPANPDARDFAALRTMYKRYMLNPQVSAWLLPRDAPTDFHVVRKHLSVQLAVTPASPPEIIPPDAPQAPFPTKDDLWFLDRVEAGFAFGHVWGNLNTDVHPYTTLAGRAGRDGWTGVRSRKFASDVMVGDALECVEYVWFFNHTCIVVLSRIPLLPVKKKVCISEVLFFAPVERSDIPPQRPELVVLVHDRAFCTDCSIEICQCPNRLGVKRGNLAELSAMAKTRGEVGDERARVSMSWEERMRMVWHGNKRGVLTLLYSTPVGKFPRITVRQAYVSACANQDDIAYRIQQQLTKFLAKLPRVSTTDPHQQQKHMPEPRNTLSNSASACDASASDRASSGVLPSATDECGRTFAPELSDQSPISFTPSPHAMAPLPKDAVWFEPPKQQQSVLMSSPTRNGGCGNNGKSDGGSCCPKSAPMFDLKDGSSPIQASPKQEQPNLNPNATSMPSSRSVASSAAETLPLRSATFQQQSSVCAPEKAGVDCDCNAEDMPDPSLARILNSSRDLRANPTTDINDFNDPVIDPMMTTPAIGCNLFLQPMPNLERPFTANASKVEDKATAIANIPSRIRFGSQSPESGKVGVISILQSPLPPPPPLLPEEPPLKRARANNLPKIDNFNLTLDTGWHVGFDEREKSLQLPSWNMSAIPERPLSALSKALGFVRSPSPLALLSNMHNNNRNSNYNLPSPLPAGDVAGIGNVPKFAAKGVPQDPYFQNHFESNIAGSEAQLMEVDRKYPGTTRALSSGKGMQLESSENSGSRHRSDSVMVTGSEASTGSGVCCELCGISFAKRSNKMRHIQTVHNRVKQFECDLCGSKFGLKADLGRHRYRIHESRAFCCETCGKSFAERDQLDLHVRVTHEEDARPWECKQCRIRFGRKSSLTRHEQTVHQQTRFTCRFCKKSYSQKFDAIRHERKVHGFNDKASTTNGMHNTKF